MYVCVCNGITDKQIRKAAQSGIKDLWALQAKLGVATNCGTCADVAVDILAECHARPSPGPVVHRPALGDALPAPA